MKRMTAALLALMMLFVLVLPASAAGDVNYQTFQVNGKSITANWGTRGEVCDFLSPYAQDYYTSEFSYDVFSALDGGTAQSDAPQSELYQALQAMMEGKQTHKTTYGETRDYYRYTDCVGSDPEQFCSFYSGVMHSGTWDSGATWNREHTWPKSKGIKDTDAANDIMMLRPTIVKENSSRGNKAYGESSGYFDPGADVRGDCARIVLYVYTRWGKTSTMWGTGGVIESMDVLLAWMEEDPVDTWEMGRNDAVQSITGVRNVFVDYPEYAFLLFGQEVPEDLVTPYKTERESAPPVVQPTEPTVPPTGKPTEPSVPATTQPSVPATTKPSAPAGTNPSVPNTTKPVDPPVSAQPALEFPTTVIIVTIVVAVGLAAVVIVLRKRK